MDFSKYIEYLKSYHQSTLAESYIKGLENKTIEFNGESEECCPLFMSEEPTKVTNMLPVLNDHQDLDIFELFVRHSNDIKISVNVPATFYHNADRETPFLIVTKPNRKVLTVPIVLSDFLLLFNEREPKIPEFCLKIPKKGLKKLLSKHNLVTDHANTNEPVFLIQKFINCKTNPASVTRVL